MARVILDDVSVRLDPEPVLTSISLAVPDGAFVAITGPSGSGKSTLLRAVAGLIPIEGAVLFGNVDVTEAEPRTRDIGFVFQTPALLPRRNVRGNVEFPLEMRRLAVESIRQRVDAEVRALHIEHLLLRRPDELARGEEQLVQIARALVRTPRVLLLDEPFAALDEHLRHRMRSEIRMLQEGYGVTTIMATNDPADLFTLASIVAVLGEAPSGVGNTIIQIGTPDELHRDPVSIGVATQTGPLWVLPAQVTSDGEGHWLTLARSAGAPERAGTLRLRAWSPTLAAYRGRTVDIGLRTDGLRRDDEHGELLATLERIVPGSHTLLLCDVDGHNVMAHGNADASELGTVIGLRVEAPLLFDPDDGHRVA